MSQPVAIDKRQIIVSFLSNGLVEAEIRGFDQDGIGTPSQVYHGKGEDVGKALTAWLCRFYIMKP